MRGAVSESDNKQPDSQTMKIATFGEIMMRLNPEGYYRFVQADKFEVSYGGGEANVAVSLANYGMDAAFVTKLPDNPLGVAARNEVRRFGVDTSSIVWGGPRLGIYFAEKGASQRASKVVYDRAGSSIALASRKDFDWAKILKGVVSGDMPRRAQVLQGAPHHGELRPQLPRQAVD